MYTRHPVFIQPPDENIKLWRYMSFTKLVSLLESQCLFFSRVDNLGDRFEGSMPWLNSTERFQMPPGVSENSRPAILESVKTYSVALKQWPRYIAVNCWHMNEYESAAMWEIYLEGNEGVAIQSRYKRLKDSFINEEQIYLGVVRYIDYQTESIDAENVMSPFMYKRKSFEHEKEVRALIIKPPVPDGQIDFSKETIVGGLKIKVNMGVLIERIYVAPASPRWYEELVRSVVTKYGHAFEVKHSGLDEPPLF